MTKAIESPLKVGNAVIIRTVTNYIVGQIVSIDAIDIVLTDAAWIPSTGRWHGFLKDGTPDEVEPYLDAVAVARTACVDITTWRHKLPLAQR